MSLLQLCFVWTEVHTHQTNNMEWQIGYMSTLSQVGENERGFKTRVISSIRDELLCLVPAGCIKLCPPIEGSTFLAVHEVVLFYEAKPALLR